MIRSLEAHDREAVLALIRATGNFNDAEVVIASELIDICVEQPDQQDYFAYVAETKPSGTSIAGTLIDEKFEIAGFLLLGPTPATTGTYDMYWIAVDPKYYGRGIAQALDQFAETFVTGRGGYWLIAETSGQPAYQRTRAFYEKQGYKTLTRIPDYYKPSDDLIVYGKRLA
jgi:ribosomal protein S18 acetylase RimI-like enzyme